MPTYEVEPGELAKVIMDDHFERVEEGIRAIQRTVAVEGPRIFQEEVDRTEPHKPVDRGEYRRHARVYETPRGAIFANDAPHAPIVEDGRRPGRWPPRDAIEGWVRRKFRLRISELVPARQGRSVRAARERWFRSMAFLVSRKIARRGIEGRHVMARTEARLTPLVEQAVRSARGEVG